MDIRVIGLGNVLMGDDGFGPFVIHELLGTHTFAPSISVMDVGTPGLDLTPYLMRADRVIVLDTVRSDGPAGTIRLYRKDEILRHAPQPRLGPHDPGLKETLLALDFADSGPADVLLVGVVPQRVEAGSQLSDTVRDAVPFAIDEVVRELARLGAPAGRRMGEHHSGPWWEATVTVPPRSGLPRF